jgi:hypothetical protein
LLKMTMSPLSEKLFIVKVDNVTTVRKTFIDC